MRREVAVLLAAAALLFSANSCRMALPALDDCFYARKAVEMERSGGFFTVTWGDSPAYQNPPLQIWLTARALALFGANDFAARLPSMLMALGVLALTIRIGRHTVGPAAGVGAAALLVLSPLFVNHARRSMLEVPLTFWVAVAVLVLLEGQGDPRRHALFALPLGAAILTKSVLGLLPLGILAAGAAAWPPLRASLCRPWIWLGVAGGIALGASWTVHQWIVFGPAALRAHYVDEIVSRSTQGLRLRDLLLAYPTALLASFQPAILPAIPGAWSLWKRWRTLPRDPSCLLWVWAGVPVVLYSLSSARSARYLFPIFPALALCASQWITERFPRFAAALRTAGAPALAVAAAVVFWVWPQALATPGTTFYKEDRVIAARVPEGEPLTYLGARGDFWAVANPLLYYTGRRLEAPSASLVDALRSAAGRRSGLILVQRNRWEELQGTAYTVVLDRPAWVLVQPHLAPGRGSD